MKIPKAVLEGIELEAKKAFPREACGILVGKKGEEAITGAVPSPNRARSGNEFLIDPGVQLKTQRETRARGLSVIGIYHSHPSGESDPSIADKKGPSSPGLFWLITALKTRGEAKTVLFREKMSQNPANSRNFDKALLQIVKNSV